MRHKSSNRSDEVDQIRCDGAIPAASSDADGCVLGGNVAQHRGQQRLLARARPLPDRKASRAPTMRRQRGRSLRDVPNASSAPDLGWSAAQRAVTCRCRPPRSSAAPRQPTLKLACAATQTLSLAVDHGCGLVEAAVRRTVQSLRSLRTAASSANRIEFGAGPGSASTPPASGLR